MLPVFNYSSISNINFKGLSKKADYNRVKCSMSEIQRQEYKTDIGENSKKVAKRAALEQVRAQKLFDRSFRIIDNQRTDEFYENTTKGPYEITFKDDYNSDATFMTEIGPDGLIKRVTSFDRSFYPERIVNITEYDNDMKTVIKYNKNGEATSIEKTTSRSPQINREVMLYDSEALVAYFLTQGHHEIHMEFDYTTGELIKSRVR